MEGQLAEGMLSSAAPPDATSSGPHGTAGLCLLRCAGNKGTALNAGQ